MSMLKVSALLLLLGAVAHVPRRAHAQPVPAAPVAVPSQPPRDTVNLAQRRRQAEMKAADASCVALHWWDHGVVCGASSRREEYVGGLLLGGAAGALMGAPAGLLFRGQCNRGVGSAAGRGALAGMAITTAAVTLLPRASRGELEQRDRAERLAAERSMPRRVWRGARTLLTLLGTAAVGGALIGTVDGGSAGCGVDAAAGAWRGAGVYSASAGSVALVGGLIARVRR